VRNRRFARFLACSAAILSLHLSLPAAAEEDALSKATSAVTAIIFDAAAEEFMSYNVHEDGYVDITFARNTPDRIYSDILEKLRSHPDIHGVMAGRDGPTCSNF